MPDFVTVTRRESGTHQLINLDAIEMVDVIAPEALPPLDSPLPVTDQHIGYLVLHFVSGQPMLAISETADDLAALVKAPGATADKTVELHNKRREKIEKIKADRAKERADAETKRLDETHKAQLKQHQDEVAAAAARTKASHAADVAEAKHK